MSEDIITKKSGPVPWWAQMAIAVAAGAVPWGVSYGTIQEKVATLEKRMDESDRAAVRREREMTMYLESLKDAVQRVQLDVAKICVRVKCT